LFARVLTARRAQIGAGILSFGFGFMRVGLGLGVILSFLCALINAGIVYTIFYFSERASLKRDLDGRPVIQSFEELCGECVDRRAYLLAVFSVALSVVGSLIGYQVIIGDIGHPVMQHFFGHQHFVASREFVTFAFALLIAFPLSNLRNVRELVISSVIAIVSIVLVVIGVLLRAGMELHRRDEAGEDLVPSHAHMFIWSKGILQSLPLFLFAYSTTLLTPIVYADLRVERDSSDSAAYGDGVGETRPKVELMRGSYFLISAYALLCFVLYTITGAMSYLHFGTNIQGDVLNNYDIGDSLMDGVKAVFVVHVVLAFPVVQFPFRRILRVYIFRYSPEIHARDVPFVAHTFHTLCIIVVTATVAVLVPKVQVVFGLVGATAVAFTGLVLPGAMLMALPHEDATAWTKFWGRLGVFGGAVFSVVAAWLSVSS
jgi:amino acid permease